MLVKGSTAMAGRSGSGRAARGGSACDPRPAAGDMRRCDAHVADEAQALARDGADQPLLLAAVADRLARGIDAAGQGRLRHDPAAPDRSDEIVLADDAVAVLHQVDQQVEHLRLDGNRRRSRGAARAGRCQEHDRQRQIALPRPRVPSRGDNQGNLKGKSSCGQSLRFLQLVVLGRLLRHLKGGLTWDSFIAFLYGLAAYLVFFVTFLYAIGFVEGMVVPKTIDNGMTGSMMRSADRQSGAAVALRHPAQRDGAHAVQAMVDAIRAEIGRAQHLRAARQPRACPAVLAMAADAGRGLAGRQSGRSPWRSSALSFVGWLIVLASTFLINHFELFGLHQVVNNLAGRPMPTMRLQDAGALQVRAAPDLSRLHHRVLGGADDDGRASAVRRGDHGLHLRRHLPGGARSGRAVRRRLPALQAERVSMLIPWRKSA